MAIWSKKSKSSNQTSSQGDGMIGGLSVDAHPPAIYGERRESSSRQMQASDMTVGDYMTGMPNIRLTSLLKGLMKQILWVVPLFIAGIFIIHYFTKDIKRSYRGEGRLLVQIGPEYIYTPIGASSTTGNTGGVSQTPDTIALNEVGIMKNSEVINQVIGIMTSARGNLSERQAQDLFDKDGFKKIRKAEASGSKRDIEDAYAELHKSVSNAYSVAPQPKSSLIEVAFEHESPEVATETLNQFIDAYRVYRRTVFVEGSEDTISERRDETERQLKSNERAIARFLERNDISDFTSVQTGLQKRSEDLKAELNTLRGLMSETEGSLATVEDQLRNTNPTIDLYVDDRASQRIAQAELELKQLLAKYLPTSNPVRQKRTELNELKSLQSSNNGRAAGGRRVGPNPTHQALETQRNTLQAAADSYREKEFTLQGQLNSAVEKVRRLTKLSPEHQNLLRERVTLSAALETYNARAQEALVNLAQAEANNENIKVISYATFAIKGQNIGQLILAGGSLAWFLTLVMLALLRVFLDPRNFQAPATTRKGPRRSRSTDKVSPNDNGGIPEPVAPYEPVNPYEPSGPMRKPATGGAMGSSAVAATRAYNASATIKAQATEAQINTTQANTTQASTTQASAGQDIAAPNYAPVAYEPSAYQEPTPYGNPQDYYAAPQLSPTQTGHPIAEAVQAPQDGLDMQNNPYLNMQKASGTYDGAYGAAVNAQATGLPVLGSFSASKA